MYKKTIAIMSVLVVVFLCSSSVFASTSYGSYSTTGIRLDMGIDQYVYSYINLTSFYYTTDSYGVGTSSEYQTDTYKVLGEFIIYNNHSYDIQFTDTPRTYIDVYITAQNYPNNTFFRLTDVQYLGGALCINQITSSGKYSFANYKQDNDGRPSSITIPAKSAVYCLFESTYTIDYYTNGNPSTRSNPPVFNSTNVYLDPTDSYTILSGEFHESYSSYLPDIYNQLVDIYANNQLQLSVLQQILASYNANVPIAEDATLDSHSSQTTSEQQHQVELSQFNNTNTALSNSGISNYSFNQEQVGGIGGVSNDFTYVFNALGSWNQVYIFALTLTLALAIIRHVRPKRSSND